MNLCVGFFNERHPQLVSFCAPTKYRHTIILITRQSHVNNDVSPEEVFEEPKDIEPLLPVLMENRRINANSELLSLLISHSLVGPFF